MKKFLTAKALFLLLIVGHCVAAQTSPASSAGKTKAKSGTQAAASTTGKTEQELQKVTQELAAAIISGDKSIIERYLADTYIGTSPWGSTENKAQRLQRLRPAPAVYQETVALEDVRVQDYGNTGVVNAKMKVTNAVDGRQLVTAYRLTQVFQKQNGQWKLLAAQSTAIPADRIVAKVDPALYDAYAGRYEVAPGQFLTLTREGDRLMGKMTGNDNGFEFLPANETTFFVNGWPDEATFVKDENGQVTHINHRLVDGQVVKEKKAK